MKLAQTLAHVLPTVLFAIALAVTSSNAHADVARPGSLLLFPEFDNRRGEVTIFTVTNTNTNDTIDPDTNLPGGTVKVNFTYVGVFDQNGDPIPCLLLNESTMLSPGDTFTFVAKVHNPHQEQGFMYAFAKHPTQDHPITFDFLIGNALYLNGVNSSVYSMNPLVLEGRTGAVGTTDLDGDGRQDLDGLEYEELPDRILIPRFFATTQQMKSELILIGLSGGAQFHTFVDFLAYNDNEEVFSLQHEIRCWQRVRLDDISGFFANTFLKQTNHALNEPLGSPGRETGWIDIDGNAAFSTQVIIDDPAVYAVLVEKVTRTGSTADLPFGRGTQDNGDLWPLGPGGDGILSEGK